MPDDKTIKWTNIFIDRQLICQLGVSAEDGKPILAFLGTSFNSITVSDQSLSKENLLPLRNIIAFEPEEDEMGLPAYRRKLVAGTKDPETKKMFSTQTNADKINEAMRDDLLVTIIDSFIAEPHQSKARTAQISGEISEKQNINKMSIAGVRAALTRGVYGGTLNDLIMARKRHQHTTRFVEKN